MARSSFIHDFTRFLLAFVPVSIASMGKCLTNRPSERAKIRAPFKRQPKGNPALEHPNLPPSDLADILFEELVEPQHIYDPNLVMGELAAKNYENKARIYQLAAVMIALMSAGQESGYFQQVRESLEKRVFPPTATSNALDLVTCLRDAMADLSKLLFPTNPKNQLSWARAWFSEIGLDQSNPITLSRHSMQCTDFFINARDALSKFQTQV